MMKMLINCTLQTIVYLKKTCRHEYNYNVLQNHFTELVEPLTICNQQQLLIGLSVCRRQMLPLSIKNQRAAAAG